MTRLPFTDTHVHFIDLDNPKLHYSWLLPDAQDDTVGNYDSIKVHYWADDFVAETRFANVDRVVHVQAATGIADPVSETEWLQAFADRLGVPHGIVAYADLADPDVRSVLERHAEFENMRGIRDLRYDDSYLTDDRWQRGYAELERFNFVCCDDPLVEQMEQSRDLALKFPGITLCITSAGFPRSRDAEYYDRWRRGMAAIAEAENSVVSISGLGMCDHQWTVESLRPWVLTCIELFGVDRSFFGTNWPVDRLYSSYGDVLDAYHQIIADFTPDEQAALFAGNANRVYRL
jgi:predicted TIM-barrel fold metal-dependent hydrolase